LKLTHGQTVVLKMPGRVLMIRPMVQLSESRALSLSGRMLGTTVCSSV
jgi:hypothetical protein